MYRERGSDSKPSLLKRAFICEKVETVARAKSAGACYMLVPAGRKNWSSWEGYSTVEGGGEGSVTLLAEPSFCMSCNRLAMLCKEMYERVASPG